MSLTRGIACAVAIAIAAGAFEPFYFRIFLEDRAALASRLTELPYRKLPGLRQFLIDVASRTRNGDTIAVFAPVRSWSGEYEYIYGRSLYPLAGRRVLATIDTADHTLLGNVQAADYVAAYRSAPPFLNFDLVWRGPDGTLLRKHR